MSPKVDLIGWQPKILPFLLYLLFTIPPLLLWITLISLPSISKCWVPAFFRYNHIYIHTEHFLTKITLKTLISGVNPFYFLFF